MPARAQTGHGQDDARLAARPNEGGVREPMAESGRGRGEIRSRMLKVLLPQVR